MYILDNNLMLLAVITRNSETLSPLIHVCVCNIFILAQLVATLHMHTCILHMCTCTLYMYVHVYTCILHMCTCTCVYTCTFMQYGDQTSRIHTAEVACTCTHVHACCNEVSWRECCVVDRVPPDSPLPKTDLGHVLFLVFLNLLVFSYP